MKKTTDEKFKQLLRVHDFLNHNQAALAIVPMIATIETDLKNLIDRFVNYASDADANYSGSAIGKKEARKALCEQAFAVTAAARLYYTFVVDDEILRNRAKVLPSDFTNLSGEKLLKRVRQINETALPVAALLGPYGMDQAGVLALGGLIDAFFNLIDDPKEKRKSAKTAREKMNEELMNADGLLEKLEICMMPFSFQNERLFMQYKLSVKIAHLPTNRLMKKGILQKEKSTYARYAKGYLKADTKLLLANESARTKAAALLFYFAAKPGEPLPEGAQAFELAGGVQKTIECGKSGFSAETPVLVIVNRSAKPIKWRTRVVMKE